MKTDSVLMRETQEPIPNIREKETKKNCVNQNTSDPTQQGYVHALQYKSYL